jgi:hypothetical protein
VIVAELAGIDGRELARAALSHGLRSAERVVDVGGDHLAATVDPEGLRARGQIAGAYDQLCGRDSHAERGGQTRAEEAEQHHPVLVPHSKASTADTPVRVTPSIPSGLPPRSHRPSRRGHLNMVARAGQSRNCVICLRRATSKLGRSDIGQKD